MNKHDPLDEENAVAAPPKDLRDGPIEETKRIICSGGPEGCVKQCHYSGVACFPRVEHPYKPEVGTGDLFACRTTGHKSCEFKPPANGAPAGAFSASPACPVAVRKILTHLSGRADPLPRARARDPTGQ